ncbi:transcriptional regulator ovo isoform X2 [Haematobia irritans]|uniref:transcriptional regulator ovo isoform X2 n=1 Tax=Haematobia irritans TaxID=7368 RepID=UPI003F4FF591
MPKIFLIKNRLHQQQQRLLESQNLLHDKTDDDRLVPPLSPSHHGDRDRSTSPPYHQPRPQTFPEPQDFPRSSNGSPSNIASTSDSLKALHIHSQQQKDICSLARSRSQSPIGEVLDLHKKSSPSSSASKNSTKLRATEDYEGDEEEQPLSLVSSLTYLGRKRFHQYHRNLRTSSATSSLSVTTTLPSKSSITTTENSKVDNNETDKAKEENNEVGPVASFCANDRLSPPETTTTADNSTKALRSRSSSPASPIDDDTCVASCSTSSIQLQDCPESLSKVTNPKAEDHQQETKQPATVEPNDSPKSASPKHRYITSYKKSLIGGVILTQAQRKEYPLEIVEKFQKEETSVKPLRPTEENFDSDSDSDDGSKLIVDEKPLVPEEQPISLRVRSSPPREDQRPSPPPCPEPAVRCSVIQRTPSNLEESQRRRRSHEVLLPLANLEHLGPEQQEPIDYHVPRRRSTIDNDEEQHLNAKRLERERKLREARRRSALLAARTILAQARVNPRFIRSLPGILAAAAGHGRTTSGSNSGNQGQGFQNGFGGSNGSGSQQHSGGGGSPTGFGGSGGLSGGAGGGGMGGGRDGRGNYGPNSPPSGALPPFYESLKSGSTMNGSSTTNFNSSATSNFLLQNAAAYLMSAAGSSGGSSGGVGQQYTSSSGGDNIGGGGVPSAASLAGSSPLDQTPSSASSMLFANGHAYGIILKDEPDLEEYDEAKIDIGAFAQNIIQATMGNSGNFNASAYEDAIMSDLASAAQGPNGSIVDPLQFTATLMLSSQTDHLLEQLSDAVDLSSFLQRNCVDDENSTSPRQDFELVSTPSLTPDSVSITPVDCHNSSTSHLDSFHENLMQQLTNNITRTQQTAANYAPYERQQQQQPHHQIQQQQQQPPPSYQHATRDIMHMQQQQHQQNHQHPNNYQQNQTSQPLNSLLNQNNLLMQQQQHQQHYQQQQQHGNSYHHMQHQQAQHSHQQQHSLPLNQHHQQQNQHMHHHHGGHSGHHSQHSGNNNGQHGVPPHHLMQHHSDNSNLSLPSPNSSSAIATTANGHMMIPSQGHHPMSSAASNTSTGSAAALLDTSLLDTKPIIQSLGLPPEVQLEFVNGGHGIKNPLAIENTHGHHHRIRSIDCMDDMKKPMNGDSSMNGSIGGNSNSSCGSSSGNGIANGLNNNENNAQEPSNFVCRICLKSFTLKRLLNRHMKCHSEIKRYLCTFCGKGFNDTFDLKRHTRTHTGVRPYKCNLCEKSFTQRCSLESHCLKVHSMQHQYAYKERRTKMYVCEECGHTTCEPEVHYIHLKENHPYSPALLKFYDKRHFKFNNSQFANNLLGQLPMPVHN